MRGGRAGRHERSHVAARVRALLAGEPAEPGSAAESDRRYLPGPGPRAGLDPPGDLDEQASDAQGSGEPGSMHPPDGPGVPAGARRLRLRFDPGHRGAVGLGVAVVAVAVVSAVWVFSSRPHSVAVTSPQLGSAVADTPTATPSGTRAASGAPPPPASTSAAPPPLVVDVAGKVRHPGLYHLPAGSRIYDAVRAAGGPLSGVSLTSLNLAAKLSDGEQIVVDARSSTVVAGGPAGSGTAGPGGPVDLNTATLEQLETLPGIGPALGQRILDWRAAHGQFTSVSQLREVAGIGDTRLAQLRARVTV